MTLVACAVKPQGMHEFHVATYVQAWSIWPPVYLKQDLQMDAVKLRKSHDVRGATVQTQNQRLHLLGQEHQHLASNTCLWSAISDCH